MNFKPLFGLIALTLLGAPSSALAEAPEKPTVSVACVGQQGQVSVTYLSVETISNSHQQIKIARNQTQISTLLVQTNEPYVQFSFESQNIPFQVDGYSMVPGSSGRGPSTVVPLTINGETFFKCPAAPSF